MYSLHYAVVKVRAWLSFTEAQQKRNRCTPRYCCSASVALSLRESIGGDGRARTGDLLRAREALSQLSYVPIWRPNRRPLRWVRWWAIVESNHAPRPYQGRALTD
jgi:hypothetical protein